MRALFSSILVLLLNTPAAAAFVGELPKERRPKVHSYSGVLCTSQALVKRFLQLSDAEGTQRSIDRLFSPKNGESGRCMIRSVCSQAQPVQIGSLFYQGQNPYRIIRLKINGECDEGILFPGKSWEAFIYLAD